MNTRHPFFRCAIVRLTGVVRELLTGTPRRGARFCALAFCALELASNSHAIGPTNYTVAPIGYDHVEGNGREGLPFNAAITLRYQLMYSASQFQGLGDNLLITELRFRVNSGNSAFDTVLPSVDIRLSTSSRTPETMSLAFAQNVGQNETLVLPKGPLHLSSQLAGFDVAIPLTTPFLYNPSEGSLLIDVRKYDTSTINSDLDSVVYPKLQGAAMASLEGIGATSVAGVSVLETGLVAKFGYQVVPEPRTYAFVGLGLVGYCLCRTVTSRRISATGREEQPLSQSTARTL